MNPRVGTRVTLDSCQNEKCGRYVYFETGDDAGNDVKDMYPALVEEAPEGLPDRVAQAFREALSCQGGKAPNGALLMCRRAIQEALDDLGAKKGTSQRNSKTW